MHRKIALALVAAVLVAAALTLAAAPDKVVVQGSSAPSPAPQPDTTSPNWRFLSADVGVLLRHDDLLGMRGRLFVRVNGAWQPVALDGVGDIRGIIPAR